MLKVTLEDIMSEDIVTISEHATLGQAAHLLLRFRINGILVVKKNDKKKIVGILTTTDLLKLLDYAFSGHAFSVSRLNVLSQLSVGSVSNKEVLKIQKDTDIKKVIKIMHKKNVHTIPVYDGDKLVGVIGKHDILNVAFA